MSNKKMKRGDFLAVLWLAFAAVFFFAGCMGYKFGNPNTPPFQSIHANVASNQSYLQQAIIPLSDAIRKSFITDSTVELRNSEDAQALLDVTIVDYTRHVGATMRDDSDRAQSFTATITVSCTLKDKSGKVYFKNKRISISQTIYTQSGAELSEFQSYPEFAANLANKIRDAVLNTW